MKFIILLLVIVSQQIIAQENCPSEELLGKWKSDDFGINVECGKITILDKLNNWDLSEKRKDTYYILEMLIKEKGKYVCRVRNFVMGAIMTGNHKVQKIPAIQYRILQLEVLENGSLEFLISEKSVEYANMKRANWSAVNERYELFEGKFKLEKFIQELPNKKN